MGITKHTNWNKFYLLGTRKLKYRRGPGVKQVKRMAKIPDIVENRPRCSKSFKFRVKYTTYKINNILR